MPPQSRTLPVKVAAFDLDDTLIIPTSGNKWARSASGWKWWDQSIPHRLQSLHKEGYLVVVLSNQGNISLKDNPKSLQKDTQSLINLKSQVGAIFTQLAFPISIYAATGQDRYRKPRVGMWDEMLEDYDLQAEGAVDLSHSFYVGDAAGRDKTDKRRKDHSNSDRSVFDYCYYSPARLSPAYFADVRDLAINIGINFHTPEEFFLNTAPEQYNRAFDPVEYLSLPGSTTNTGTVSAPFTKNGPQELVIFCGSPGAGKSSFYWDVLSPLGYERVNQDILKTVRSARPRTRQHLFMRVSAQYLPLPPDHPIHRAPTFQEGG